MVQRTAILGLLTSLSFLFLVGCGYSVSEAPGRKPSTEVESTSENHPDNGSASSETSGYELVFVHRNAPGGEDSFVPRMPVGFSRSFGVLRKETDGLFSDEEPAELKDVEVVDEGILNLKSVQGGYFIVEGVKPGTTEVRIETERGKQREISLSVEKLYSADISRVGGEPLVFPESDVAFSLKMYAQDGKRLLGVGELPIETTRLELGDDRPHVAPPFEKNKLFDVGRCTRCDMFRRYGTVSSEPGRAEVSLLNSTASFEIRSQNAVTDVNIEPVDLSLGEKDGEKLFAVNYESRGNDFQGSQQGPEAKAVIRTPDNCTFFDPLFAFQQDSSDSRILGDTVTVWDEDESLFEGIGIKALSRSGRCKIDIQANAEDGKKLAESSWSKSLRQFYDNRE